MQILQHYNGRCENLELAMDLLYESKSEGRQLKNGELVAVFNGLKIEMSSLPSQNGENGNIRTVDIPYNGAMMRSSILNGGIRSRMRLRSSTSPSQSQNGIPPSNAVVPANSVMPINSNGGLVQSPSTGAVRRTSGINQWDQQPPPQQPMPNAIPNNHQRLPQNYPNTVMAIPQSQQTPQPPPQAPQQGQVAVPENGEMRDDDDEELPQGWERRVDPYGRRYYVDHNTRST
jgi:atrophin-1 interacting protein 5 (WW domain-containing E3 ubiquitin protein ligase 1)